MKSMKNILRICVYVALLMVLMSRGGADAAMKKGDRFFALGEYYDAATQYRKAYQQTDRKSVV